MVDPREVARWRRVTEALRAEAERIGDPRVRARKLVELGDVWFDRLGEPLQASVCYVDAIATRPGRPEEALRRLSRLARESGDPQLAEQLLAGLERAGLWADAVRHLTARVQATEDSRLRTRLRLRIARLYAERIGDTRGARDQLVAACEDAGPGELDAVARPLMAHLGEQPDDEPAATAVARLLARHDRPTLAIDILVEAAAHLSDMPRKAALLFEAAHLCPRARRAAAAPSYLYEALVYDPRRESEVLARFDWLEQTADDDEIVEALVGVYDRMGRTRRSQALLSRRAEATRGAESTRWRLRRARHAEETLDEPERAFELYRAAAERAEDATEALIGMQRTGLGRPDAFDTLLTVCRQRGLWAQAVELLADEARLRDDAERAALLHQAGEIYERRLDRPDQAMSRYVEAFRLQPRNPTYLEAGQRLYAQLDEWQMVDRLLGLRIRVIGDDHLRRELLVERARVRLERLDNPMKAYDAVRAALRKTGESTIEDGAFSLLRQLVADDFTFATISRGLHARAEEAETDAEGARALLELAALYLDIREETDQGLSLARLAADRDPHDPTTFRRAAGQIGYHAGAEAEIAWLLGATERPLPEVDRVAALRMAARRARDADRPSDALRAWQAVLERQPTDAEAFAEAVAAADAADDHAGAAELLERALDGALGPAEPTVAQRRAWLRGLARAREAAGLPDAAAQCYRTLLDALPADPPALEAYSRWLADHGEWAELADRHAAALQVREAETDVLEVDAREALARLHAERLDDPEGAAVWLEPLALMPDLAEALLPRLFDLYAACRDRRSAIRLARGALHAASEPEARRAAAARLVELAGVADPYASLDAQLDPSLFPSISTDVTALDADPDADSSRDTTPPAAPPVEGVAFDESALTVGLMALVQASRGANDPAASDPTPARQLAELARATGDVEALRIALDRLAELDDGPSRLEHLRARARLATEQRDIDDAIYAWGAVLTAVEDDTEALAALQRLQARRGDDTAVHDLLWRRQAALSDAGARIELLREAAVVAELRLGEPERTVEAWRTILSLRPDDPEALDELMRLSEEQSDWATFGEAAVARIETLDGRERADLARRLAELSSTTFEDDEAALAWWRIVAEADPDDPQALAALATDAERRGEVDIALLMWGRLAAGRADADTRRMALIRRAHVLEGQSNPAGAIDAWRAVAEAYPDDPTPHAEIRRLAIAADDPVTAAEAVVDEMTRVPPADRVPLERVLARLSADALRDPLGAASAWERVLAHNPQDEEALLALVELYADQDRALEMLRTLDALARASAPEDAITHLVDAARRVEARGADDTAFECWQRVHVLEHGAQERTLDALVRLAESTGRWRGYAEALAIAARRVDDPEELRHLLLEAAGVWAEELDDLPKAFAQVESVCRLDPADRQALDRLEELARWMADDATWLSTAAARERAAEALPPESSAHLARAAAIHETERRRPDLAFALYARAFEGPGGDEVIDDLLRLAAASGDWSAVTALFGTRARSLTDPVRQAGLFYRLAAALDAQPMRQEAAFEQALMAMQLRPVDPAISALVHRLAHTLDEWTVVERVLRLALEHADEPETRVPLLRAIAELQAGPMGDDAASFDTLKRAFALDPGDAASRAALESMANARDARAELADFYEEEAGWAESRAHRIALYRAAAQLFQALGDTVRAAAVLARLDRVAPEGADVDARLDLLRGADDAAPLAEALERQVERAEGSRSLEFLRELAILYADRLGQPESAEGAWTRILDIRPHDDDAFEALATSYEARKAWDALDALLARRSERTTAAIRRRLLRRRAEVLHRHLGRPVEGFDLLAEVFRFEPTDMELLRVLAHRAAIADAWVGLMASAERAVAFVPRADLPEVLLLIGRTARDRLDDPRKALNALSRALGDRTDDVPLAREVAALQRQRKQYGALVELHQRIGPALLADAQAGADDPALRARFALSVAELQAGKLYAPGEAVITLRALLDEQPDHLDALRQLRTLCVRAGDHAGLYETAMTLAERTTGAERLSTLVESARAMTSLGDTDRAVALWRRVLTEAPGHKEAQKAVARQAARREDWALMIEQLEARILSSRDQALKADLLVELGTLHAEKRRDPDAAAEAWGRALSVDPSHLEAVARRAELTAERGDPDELATMVEILATRLEGAEPGANARLLPLLARIQLDRAARADAAGDRDAALAILEAGHAHSPADTALGQALADALYARCALHRAAALYQVLPMPRPSGSADDARLKAEEHLRRARALRAAGDDLRAMHHFEGASNHAATRATAIEHLANLQESAGRWEAAARLREKLADVVDDPQAKRAAWVAAGMILQQRLDKPVRAMQAYDKAVDAGLGEPILLGAILALYRAQRRDDRVLQVTEKLLARDETPRRAAELWCARGEALASLGDRLGAREAWRTALRLNPGSSEAATELLEHLAYASAAERVESVGAALIALDRLEGAARVPLLAALTRWYLQRDEAEQAIEAARSLLEVLEQSKRPDPAHALLAHDTLAERLEARADARLAAEDEADAAAAARDLDAALIHRAASIGLQPGDPARLRQLASVCARVNRPGWAALPLGMLALVGEATAEERERAQTLDVHHGLPARLGNKARKAYLAGPEWRRPAGLLLNTLHGQITEAVDALLNEVRGDQGTPADEVDPDLGDLTLWLADSLGLGERHIRLDPECEAPMLLARLAPPTLIVGKPIIEQSDPAIQRFLLARGLELTRGPAVHAAYVPADEARALVAGAVVLSRPEDGLAYAQAAELAGDRVAWWAELFHTHLEEKQLDALAQFAGPVITAGPEAFEEWARRTRQTANRVAMWLSGDLALALEYLQSEDPSLAEQRITGPRALRALLDASPELADLHASAFDARFFDLLREAE